ncbi:MAG: glycosyl hydrolase, partial [Paludibacter sp.]
MFEKPSSSEYGPYTFWMWIQDHATKEGAKKDLEAMASKGYAGAYIFNLGINDGLFSNSVPKLNYMSKEWFEVVSSAMKDAKRLGMNMGMHNCSGWSHTGTMDITPEEAMKTISYSRITINGGDVNVKLPAPLNRQDFYKDIAILAYPIPNNSVQLMHDAKFKLTSNVKINDVQALYDGSISTSAAINPTETVTAKLVFAFEKPVRVSALKILDDQRLQVLLKRNISVEFSSDGIQYSKITVVEKAITQGFFTFSEVEAPFFRITFEGQTTRFLVPEIEFLNDQSRSDLPKLCDFDVKAGYSIHRRGLFFGEKVESKEIVPKNEVINLTEMFKKDSTLICNLPTGKWEILRIGYTITGRKNSGASISGSGLEVDKANKKYMDSYFEKQPQKLFNELKEYTGNTFRDITTDSWEANVFNWTDLMAEEFLTRRGYDILSYLPALTGEIIESADVTERFLLDFRKTLSELINENTYAYLAAKFKSAGMHYVSEAAGAQQFMGNGITNSSHLVEPWTEFWVAPDQPFSPARLNGGFLDAISSGHVYNKNIIAAESFTSGKGNWKNTPYDLKPATDAAFALGINKIVFHTYVHQPDESVPGWQMNPWGVAINRKLTWWEQSNSWIQYISRCHYLLRQGKPKADVLAFSGEDIGISMAYEYAQDTVMEKSVTEGYNKIEGQFSHITPYGYAWDGCDVATLTSRLTVKDHQLFLPNGISYKLLILPPNQNRVSPKLLRALKNLLQQGAIVYGKRPEKLSTLENYPNCEVETRNLIDEIWGKIDGEKIVKNNLGKGAIYFGIPIKKVLNEIAIKPDFSYKSDLKNADIIFNHRKSETEDIYFVANQNLNAEKITCTFRVFDKQPQLWDAVSGKTTLCTQFTQDENGITLTLPLESYGS